MILRLAADVATSVPLLVTDEHSVRPPRAVVHQRDVWRNPLHAEWGSRIHSTACRITRPVAPATSNVRQISCCRSLCPPNTRVDGKVQLIDIDASVLRSCTLLHRPSKVQVDTPWRDWCELVWTRQLAKRQDQRRVFAGPAVTSACSLQDD